MERRRNTNLEESEDAVAPSHTKQTRLVTSSPKNLTDQSSKAIIGASSVVVRVKILAVEKGAQAAAGMKP